MHCMQCCAAQLCPLAPSCQSAPLLTLLASLQSNLQDRIVFPISIMATKLSGTGNDATFMAVIRPVKEAAATSASGSATSGTAVHAWLSNTGIILCAEQRVTDVIGITAQELVGRPLSSLGADMQALDK